MAMSFLSVSATRDYPLVFPQCNSSVPGFFLNGIKSFLKFYATHVRQKKTKTKTNTKQNKTKQNKTNKTKQNKTKQNKTKQNKTKTKQKTKQNKTKQNKTKQNKTNKTKQKNAPGYSVSSFCETNPKSYSRSGGGHSKRGKIVIF